MIIDLVNRIRTIALLRHKPCDEGFTFGVSTESSFFIEMHGSVHSPEHCQRIREQKMTKVVVIKK